MHVPNVSSSTFTHFAGMKWCKTMTRGIAKTVKNVEIGQNGIASLVIFAIVASHCLATDAEKNHPMPLSKV